MNSGHLVAKEVMPAGCESHGSRGFPGVLRTSNHEAAAVNANRSAMKKQQLPLQPQNAAYCVIGDEGLPILVEINDCLRAS